jgi:hypothetical protein
MVAHRSTPWGTIAAVAVVVLFAAGVLGYAVLQGKASSDRASTLAAFTPSASNQDPSRQIPGVVVVKPTAGHVLRTDRVAYTSSPPVGGAHDQYWAACTGVVYDRPVRSENLVHSMEHGAAWIAYNPDRITGSALAELAGRVQNQPYTAMSPYPGLDTPISLQSWGHQLKLTEVGDTRIDQFLQALRHNQYTSAEAGASCQALGPDQFNKDQPPPFQNAPPVSEVGQPGIKSESTPQPGTQPGGGVSSVPGSGG